MKFIPAPKENEVSKTEEKTAQIQAEIDRLYDIAFSRPRQYRTGIGRRIARLERQVAA